jgi:hypothetical protein
MVRILVFCNCDSGFCCQFGAAIVGIVLKMGAKLPASAFVFRTSDILGTCIAVYIPYNLPFK